MCYLWGEKSEESTQKNILIPQLKRMHVKAVKITGGEPLIRKDIFEVIKLFTSENFKCRMISNLSIQPEKNAKKLVESGLEGLNVSIDGPKDVHDKIRGVIGAYSKTTDTLKAITKLKNLILKKDFLKMEGRITCKAKEY
jgi:MoaA/NifB/PqqE/SkfB family radical SAM enzyme